MRKNRDRGDVIEKNRDRRGETALGLSHGTLKKYPKN